MDYTEEEINELITSDKVINAILADLGYFLPQKFDSD